MLRLFALLSFFILFLPFFQTCSDSDLQKNPYLKIPRVNSIPVESVNTDTIIPFNPELRFLALKENYTKSGYEIIFEFLQNLPDFNWIAFPYMLSFAIHLLITMAAWQKRFLSVVYLGSINLALTFVPVLIGVGWMFEEWNQLKIGFWTMLIYHIVLIRMAFQECRSIHL